MMPSHRTTTNGDAVPRLSFLVNQTRFLARIYSTPKFRIIGLGLGPNPIPTTTIFSAVPGPDDKILNPSTSALNLPVSKRKISEISSEISQGHTSAQQARPLARKEAKGRCRVVAVYGRPSRGHSVSYLRARFIGDHGGGVPDSSLSGFSILVPGSKEEGHRHNALTQTITDHSIHKGISPQISRCSPAFSGI